MLHEQLAASANRTAPDMPAMQHLYSNLVDTNDRLRKLRESLAETADRAFGATPSLADSPRACRAPKYQGGGIGEVDRISCDIADLLDLIEEQVTRLAAVA